MFVYLGCGKTRRVVAVRNNLLELERNVERESRLDKRVGRLRKGKSSELSQGYERISLGRVTVRMDFSFSILFFAPLNTI